MQDDEASASAQYAALEKDSAEAQAYLARTAFKNKRWDEARRLTRELLTEFPDELILRKNLEDGGLAFALGLAGEYVADSHARLCGTDLRARFCDGLVSSMGRLGGATGDVHFVPGLFLVADAGGTKTGMKAQEQMKPAGLATAVFTAWSAGALFEAWQHSPFDRADAVAWVIWIAPVVASLLASGEASLGWLIAALAISMAGAFLELNLAKQIGFAVACAGLTGGRMSFWLWLPAALSWMPVLGWCVSGLGTTMVGGLRVALAAAGTTAYFSKR
jgi:hypothetical protein